MVLKCLAVVNNLLPTNTVQGPRELPSHPAKYSTTKHQDPIKRVRHIEVLVRNFVRGIPQQGSVSQCQGTVRPLLSVRRRRHPPQRGIGVAADQIKRTDSET